MGLFESLRKYWKDEFNKGSGGEKLIPFFCESRIMKMIWLDKYKSLAPIEKMAEVEKKEIKRYVIDLFPNKTTDEKLEACKIIYTFGSYLQDL